MQHIDISKIKLVLVSMEDIDCMPNDILFKTTGNRIITRLWSARSNRWFENCQTVL